MVCATRSFEALYSRTQAIDRPPPDDICQLAREIRKGWSPQTRAKRAAAGSKRAEAILTLVQLQSREERLQNHFYR